MKLEMNLVEVSVTMAIVVEVAMTMRVIVVAWTVAMDKGSGNTVMAVINGYDKCHGVVSGSGIGCSSCG